MRSSLFSFILSVDCHQSKQFCRFVFSQQTDSPWEVGLESSKKTIHQLGGIKKKHLLCVRYGNCVGDSRRRHLITLEFLITQFVKTLTNNICGGMEKLHRCILLAAWRTVMLSSNSIVRYNTMAGMVWWNIQCFYFRMCNLLWNYDFEIINENSGIIFKNILKLNKGAINWLFRVL